MCDRTRLAVPPPPRKPLFGVLVSVTDYDGVTRFVIEAARRRRGVICDFMAVHGLVTAVRSESYRNMLNEMDVVAPDGQPVRWALNRLHRAGLTDRVYGPEQTLRACDAAAEAGISVYLYGGTLAATDKFRASLVARFPSLQIAGAEPSPIRPLTPQEDEALVKRIVDSGAGVVLLGLGCPKQEIFAIEHRDRIPAAMLCIGAAFDFHAGVKRMAPRWMQRCSLEWLYRLCQEPRRLWKRYLVTNSIFVYLVVAHWVRNRGFSSPSTEGDGVAVA